MFGLVESWSDYKLRRFHVLQPKCGSFPLCLRLIAYRDADKVGALYVVRNKNLRLLVCG